MKPDKAFVEDWRTSQDVVNTVALWLEKRGKRAFLFPVELRPHASQRSAYRDQGDIMVLHNGHPYRIEVKARGIRFTGAHDYPYATVYIDEAYKLEPRSDVDPLLGYCIVSGDVIHVAFIHSDTVAHWVQETRRDPKQGRDCTFVACPKAHVRWFHLGAQQKRKAA